MKTFYNEHPVIVIVVGAVTAFIGNYIGGMIMGKGFGQLVVNQANEVADAAGLPHIDE